jgi:hypothetical protein
MEISSNLTAIFVAVPMLAIMAAAFFRVDEAISKPSRKMRRMPLAGGLDENGVPIGIDPDGNPITRAHSR